MNNEQSIGADQAGLLNFLLVQHSVVMLVVIFGGMLVFMVAEQLCAGTETESAPVSRWLTNWSLAFLNYFAALWIMSSLGAAAWIQAHLAALQLTDVLPALLVVALLVVSVEFVSYWAHRLLHKVPTLWHVHAVHHMDTELDVTTSHRHHFLEVLAMTLLITPVFVVFGVPIWAAFVYQLLRIVAVLFNHSNLQLPVGLERRLRLFIVTPAFHRVHHSSDPALTNSNYGTVVPWFDYLFGTASQATIQPEAPVGLGYLSGSKDGRFHRILLLPFMWRQWKIGEE